MAFQVSDLTTLGIPQTNRDLGSMLAEYTAVETPEDYRCEVCKSQGRQRKLSFARMPDRFAIAFQRFQRDYRTSTTSKISHRVTFPTQNLDLSPYWIGPQDRFINGDPEAANMAREDRHFKGPFLYDCYAVICHIGSDLSGGHYIAYVRDESSNDPTDWFKFDDSRVDKVKVGSTEPRDELEKMYKSGNQQAYMVFYKRKDT
jgi:ubiquitin carboxyl-terminal hydrolase 8